MARFEVAYRRLLDGLVSDLSRLAAAAVREAVEAARSEQQAKQAKASRLSPRLRRALELVEQKRALAAERRARSVATRPPPRSGSRRGPSAAATSKPSSAEPAATRQAPLPPPLFVHKRNRDGSIEHLERGQADSAPPPA